MWNRESGGKNTIRILGWAVNPETQRGGEMERQRKTRNKEEERGRYRNTEGER